MADLYDTAYGIYNHRDGRDRPLASVAMHRCEDVNSNSLLEKRLKDYVESEIHEYFKLSVLEWLDLPKNYIETMKRVAADEEERRARILQELEDTEANKEKAD